MGRPRLKSVYDSSVTLHLTVKERTNIIICELAARKESTKSKIIEELLQESQTFKKAYAMLNAQNRFY